MASLIGLIASMLLYLFAMQIFVWVGKRRVRWGARRGIPFGPAPRFPSAAEIWKRHGVETTVIFGVVFVLLALMNFTIWGRLGFGALSALYFGSIWYAESPADLGLPETSSVMRAASNTGYWCLAVFDWFGYMSVLCFFTAAVIDLL